MKKKILTITLCGVIALSLNACGNSATEDVSEKNEISTSETSQNEISEVSEASNDSSDTSEKEDKNGFDEATNNIVEWWGHDLSLPSYYEADSSNNPISTQNYYANENGNNAALFQLQISSTGTPKDALSDDFANSISSLGESLEDFEEIYRGTTTLAGDDAYYSDFTCTVNDINFTGKVVATKHDNSSTNMYAFFLLQDNNSKYDYFNDFDKIIETATWGNDTEDTLSPTSTPTSTPTSEPTPEVPLEYSNALSKAHDYLDFSSFSYTGLVEQLEFEGFSTEAATYAVDNCGADWNEQAAAKAQSYLDFSSFSRQGLVDQLIFEGFTAEQAEYGVTAVGY